MKRFERNRELQPRQMTPEADVHAVAEAEIGRVRAVEEVRKSFGLPE